MRLISVLGGLSALFLALSLMFMLALVGATFFVILLCYFAYARFELSPSGGNVQSSVRQLVLNSLEWNGEGKVIDIGCGNAPLTIELAKRFPRAKVVGIDYWGAKWDYSKSICEKNARIEGVSNQVSFQKASASALPFEDGYFDAAVSNLVFHEVSDTRDKREVVREALRVVKKGGKFAFQDLFLEKRIYGESDQLVNEIRAWGIEHVEIVTTNRSESVPRLLRVRFMLGAISIIYGTK
jgi:ubiquinone/menaquinone biosynthesis C-methylase UbiE